MKNILVLIAMIFAMSSQVFSADMPKDANNFYKSDKLTMKKVKFKSLYDMKIAGNLYLPENFDKNKKYSAIIVGHPMGAVKEQSANLYAQKMADEGFVTLSIDLPYWGESDGKARNSVSPDMYSEAFSSALDYLGTRPFVDKENIGVIGICGSGSFAISAAKIDNRIKAIVTISMYDMGSASRNSLNKSLSLKQRKEIINTASNQRYVEFNGGEKIYTSGTALKINENSHPIDKEFYEFYRTKRGEFTPKGATNKTTTKPTLTSNVKFMNFYPFNDIETISPRAMLFITGDKAHSKEFSEDAYKKASQPKELYYVKGAGHVDLYDREDMIPFEKINKFFKNNL